MSFDDFGDASFLEDFDPDAAIAQRGLDSKKPELSKAVDEKSCFSIGTKKDESIFTKKQRLNTENESDALLVTELDSNMKDQLTKTLSKHFGYAEFRKGQFEVVSAILQGKDCAVFWSTGSGKSICYQIPPLHTGKIALIVSPLISLMEDQVSKMNGLLHNRSDGKRDVAVFLGSAQTDSMAERRALDGYYSIIYCTPEKLVQKSFLEELAQMHQRGKQKNRELCLIAVDEAHCVSEWGHDFRTEYRQVGSSLRSHPVLTHIPIVALTATAVPKVQNDICSSLHLRRPTIIKQSFDRENLIIHVRKKPAGGYRVALASFVQEMKDKGQKKRRESTIIYCPTKNLVDDITRWLASELKNQNLVVQSYHAGHTSADRSNAHVNFLTGKTSVIVATIAFGMGIDKSDIRRVIHYSPPKTLEEYYQQIGRAGRDGLESYCVMFCNSNDFDSYKSDFYLGNLNATIRANQEASIEFLRAYATSDEICRRAELLRFFGETPKFGERCGTCDNCKNRKIYSDDIERDFADSGARLVLYALSVLNEKQGVSILEKILQGNRVDTYRYKNSIHPDFVSKSILTMKSGLSGYKKRVPVSYFTKDLLPALVNRGFVSIMQQRVITGGRTNTWSSYKLTEQGWSVVKTGPILLPVPQSIREYEEEHRKKVKNDLDRLVEAGIDVSQIPTHEIQEGDGAIMKSFRTYFNYIDLLRKGGRIAKIDQLEDLRLRIDAWRMDMASQYRISPSDAMQDHLLLNVAYTASSMKNYIVSEALVSIGVRSAGVEDLVSAINEWIDEHVGPQIESKTLDSKGDMILPDGLFTPEKPWEYFVYKPVKKTGKACWESSYDRFTSGEHVQSIAMNPENGRPIKVATVLGHIFDGLLSGRSVNFNQLAAVMPPPQKSEWDEFVNLEADSGIDVTADPKTSGKNGESFSMNEFLAPMLGDSIFSKENSDRTPDEIEMLSKYYNFLRWYMTLRRIGYKPKFTA